MYVAAGVTLLQKKKTLCLIPVPTLPTVYCRLLSPRGTEAAIEHALGF
jgi:hypothetical protein